MLEDRSDSISSIYKLVDLLENKFGYTRSKAYKHIKKLIDKDLVVVYDSDETSDAYMINPYLLFNYKIVENNKSFDKMIDYLRSTVWYDYNIEATSKIYNSQI